MSTGLNQGYSPVSDYLKDEREHRRQLAGKVNDLNKGKFNATIDITLSSSASTTVTDSRIATSSYIAWMPQTSNAALALSSGIYCNSSTMQSGAAVLTHGTSSQTDRSFRLLIIG